MRKFWAGLFLAVFVLTGLGIAPASAAVTADDRKVDYRLTVMANECGPAYPSDNCFTDMAIRVSPEVNLPGQGDKSTVKIVSSAGKSVPISGRFAERYGYPGFADPRYRGTAYELMPDTANSQLPYGSYTLTVDINLPGGETCLDYWRWNCVSSDAFRATRTYKFNWTGKTIVVKPYSFTATAKKTVTKYTTYTAKKTAKYVGKASYTATQSASYKSGGKTYTAKATDTETRTHTVSKTATHKVTKLKWSATRTATGRDYRSAGYAKAAAEKAATKAATDAAVKSAKDYAGKKAQAKAEKMLTAKVKSDAKAKAKTKITKSVKAKAIADAKAKALKAAKAKAAAAK